MKKIITSISCILALSAFNVQANPSINELTAGMQVYLQERGNLCLAKNSWPIDVTQKEIDAGARNAVQMPVLEKIGLVSSSIASVKVRDEDAEAVIKVKRYELTEEGKKYYLVKPMRNLASDGSIKVHQGDLCPVKLSLDKVIGWEPAAAHDGKEIVVTYTYQVDAAPWTHNPEVQKVFPAVAYVVRGAGTVQMKERYELTKNGWKAKDL